MVVTLERLITRLLGLLFMALGGGYALAALIGFLAAMTSQFQSADHSELRAFGRVMRNDALLFSLASVFLVAGIGLHWLSRQKAS
jgi:hypothetical protein